MHRSRSQIDGYQRRYPTMHQPGVIPRSSRRISPITTNGHKYELKQKIWPQETVESWFEHHSPEDRRAVYSFLNTIYTDEGNQSSKDRFQPVKLPNRREKISTPKLSSRVNSGVQRASNDVSPRGTSNQTNRGSRASKRDLGEILETLESLRPSFLVKEKGIQTSATPLVAKLPDVNNSKSDLSSEKNLKRSSSSMDKYSEIVQPNQVSDTKSAANEDVTVGRRYLSHTWRVINPRDDIELSVRPENNASSFFNYTKKVHPEYFFIHPDWY